jgi:hypothetical protein
MQGILSLVICIIGLIIFIITPGPYPNPNPPTPAYTYGSKANCIGLHMFWVGLFVFLLQYGPKMIGLLAK